MESVKVYLVGGAVRDELLGNKSADLDYVVVGGTPSLMINEGFEQVGADFPVFLHPETKDEYALARKEKKSGEGYNGFECEWDGVTLEDDLSRRDLTVNAIAKDSSGKIVDPFGGQKDLEDKILRHVSNAFEEDPVRILRVARFMCKLENFKIADETHELITKMVKRGDIDQLTPERVWKEMHRAIESENPVMFFRTLQSFGALKIIAPVINDMIGVPQRADYHAEGDVFVHTMMVLEEATLISKDMNDEDKLMIRLAALLHDVGKTTTSMDLLYHEDGTMRGSHKNHDSIHRVKPLMDDFTNKYKVPDQLKRFCTDMAVFHQRVHGSSKLSNKGFIKMFNDMNIKNKSDGRGEMVYLTNLLLTCRADALGRHITLADNSIVPSKREYPQMEIMLEKYEDYKNGLKLLSSFFKYAFESGLKQKDIDIAKVKLECLNQGMNKNKDFDVKTLLSKNQKNKIKLTP